MGLVCGRVRMQGVKRYDVIFCIAVFLALQFFVALQPWLKWGWFGVG